MSKSRRKRKPYSEETTMGDTITQTKSYSRVTKPEISIHLNAEPPLLLPINDPDRRILPRFKVAFETIVFCGGISFRTQTINISLTGALLAESIPIKFVDQVLDIVMIRHVGRIRDFFLVKGKGLEAPLRSPRIQFTHMPDAQRLKLESLIQTLEKA